MEGIPEYRSLWNMKMSKFLPWNLESWVLESGIKLKESGISRLTPESKSLWQRIRNPLPEIRNVECVESRIQNPRLSWIPLHGAKGPIRRSELTLNWTWNTHTRQVKSLNLPSVTQLILTLKICDARSVAVKYHVFFRSFYNIQWVTRSPVVHGTARRWKALPSVGKVNYDLYFFSAKSPSMGDNRSRVQ